MSREQFIAAYIEAVELPAGRDSNAIAAGHDFWLTRVGHGAGFWDGDWPEPAATLLDTASKRAGTRELYANESGEVYQI